jgi:Xaa-Pro aminopeptidase
MKHVAALNTYEQVLRHGLACWDQDKLPRQELEGRLARIRGEMRARGFGLLVIHGDAWVYGDLCFATHYAPMTREAVALIPSEGEPLLYVAVGDRDIAFARQLTWFEEVVSLGNLVREFKRRVQQFITTDGRVGLVNVREAMRTPLYTDLLGQIDGVAVESCTAWYRELRLRKSAAEIQLIRDATAIADASFEEILARLKPGVTEVELAAEADYAARCRGAEDLRILLTSGADGDRYLRPATGRKISNAERVLVYLAVCFQRYWSELGSTVVIGSPSLTERAGLDELLGLQKQFIRGATVNQNLHLPFADAGKALEKHFRAQQATGSGSFQGIGLDRQEEPAIAFTGDAAGVIPGMVLSARLMRFGADRGAVLAEPIIVHADRCETLSRTERCIFHGN